MAPDSIDVEKLLRFFQELYAHALTLQEVLATTAEVDYEDVRRKFDLQAAQQFALFYQALNDPNAFSNAVRAFLDNHPKPKYLN